MNRTTRHPRRELPKRPQDLPRAADLPAPAARRDPEPPPEPAPPKAEPSTPTTVRTRVGLDGYELELEIATDLRKVARLPAALRRLGLEPPPKPLVFERTAEGHPICPRHGVPMRAREKQGDTWYSHKTQGAHGEELWCRGYAGPDSLGYGGAVPGGEQA